MFKTIKGKLIFVVIFSVVCIIDSLGGDRKSIFVTVI